MNDIKLTNREQIGILCVAIALMLAIFLAVYIPKGPRQEFLDAKFEITMLSQKIQELELLKLDAQIQIDEQAALLNILKDRPGNFDLLTYIDQSIRKNNLTDRATFQRASSQLSSKEQPMVQLELDNISLEECVDLLHEIYTSNNLIALYKMSYLRPAKNGQGLSCSMILATINI